MGGEWGGGGRAPAMQPYIESESSYNRYRYHAIRIPPPIYRPVALAILLGLLLVGLFACSSFIFNIPFTVQPYTE